MLSQHEGQNDVDHQTDSRDRRHQRSVDDDDTVLIDTDIIDTDIDTDDPARSSPWWWCVVPHETEGRPDDQPGADGGEADRAEEGRQGFRPLEAVRVLPGGGEGGEVGGPDRHREGGQIGEEVGRVAEDRQGSRQDPPRHLHDEEQEGQEGRGLQFPHDLLSPGGGVSGNLPSSHGGGRRRCSGCCSAR